MGGEPHIDPSWQGRTVFLSGGTGFVGSHLADALVAAGARVPEEAVREVLRTVFSAEGLNRLGEKEPSLAGLNKQQGVQTRVRPMHPGAITFWKEQGLQIPAP